MNWISTKNKLPSATQKVIFLNNEMLYPDNMHTGVFYIKLNAFIRSDSIMKESNVTHWMPIPKAPMQ